MKNVIVIAWGRDLRARTGSRRAELQVDTITIHKEVRMETITITEAVRRATDPFGMNGERTAAVQPTAAEVIDRLLSQGYVIVPAAQACTSDDPHNHQGDTCPVHEISESEWRVLDGNR